MNGSEKQITWALDKIAAAEKLNDNRMADEQARYDADVAEEGEGNISRLNCRRTIHGIIDNGLNDLRNTGNAGQIIDLGVDVRSMIVTRQAALLPHKTWMEQAFRTMPDFLRWATI